MEELKQLLSSHLCERNYIKIFVKLCVYNNVELLMNIYIKYLCMKNREIIHWLCKVGKIKIAKKIFEHNSQIYLDYHNILCDACFFGHLNIVKWLTKINPNIKKTTYEEGFRYSCSMGNFKLIKWLYNKYPDINMNTYNDFAFHKGCENGKIKTVKFLFEKSNVNLNIYNDYGFRAACKNNHIQLANWLITKNPNKYKIVYANEKQINFEIKYTYEKKYNIKREICCVCFDSETDIILDCDHKYCKKCIEEWCYCNNNNNCPLCRKENIKIFSI